MSTLICKVKRDRFVRFYESNSIEVHNVSTYIGNRKLKPIRGTYDYRIGEKHKVKSNFERKQAIRAFHSLFKKELKDIENTQDAIINLLLTTSKLD